MVALAAPDGRMRLNRLTLSRFALLVLLAGRTALAGTLAIPLSVDETAGVARHAWPATVGVPLPRGRVRSPEAVWLAKPDGRPAPLQTRALERWPDGSVRWLLVDFLADVAARRQATYTLRDGTPPKGPRAPELTTKGRGGTHVVDAGALRVEVHESDAALLARLTAGTHRIDLPLPELTTDTAGAAPPAPGRVTVETQGPVRTELLLTGRYPQGLAYELRLAAFAGRPFVRLQYTVTNVADPDYMQIRSLPIVVPGAFAAAEIGVDERTREWKTLVGSHELRQLDAAPVTLDGDTVGRHGAGWVRATGGGITATVAERWFWETYPQSITVAPKRIALDLFAGADQPVRLGSGAAVTHELWIAVEDGRTAAPAGEMAVGLATPLAVSVRPEWTVATQALPNALAPNMPGAHGFLGNLVEAYRRYDKRVRTERWDDGPPVPCSQRTSEHPRTGFYGVLNWGDWNFPKYRDPTEDCDGWGNLEYDLPQVLGLGWMATTSIAFLDGFMAAARHYRDVDVIHHSAAHPDWVGLNHPHKALHFAPESHTNVDLGHVWLEGLVTHYRLTGEVRSLEVARGIADALLPRLQKAGNPRQYGWPMIALAAAFDATGDPRYAEGARRYADAGVVAYRPTPASGDWKMGILADGVASVQATARDEGLQPWLLAYADALLADPKFSDPRYSLPLGWLAARTGNRAYETRALAVAADIKIGDWGKPLAAEGRTGFRLLGPLAGRDDAVAAPPKPPVQRRPSDRRR